MLAQYSGAHLATSWRHAAIGRDELCSCANGGRLLQCQIHGRGGRK
jgi:formylmethanofuran dehydrogenase subunit A